MRLATTPAPCTRAQRLFASWADVTDDDRAWVTRHGEACPACAAAAARSNALLAHLERAGGVYRGLRYEGPPPRPRTHRARLPTQAHGWWPRALSVAAALILVVGGASLMRRAADKVEAPRPSPAVESVPVQSVPVETASVDIAPVESSSRPSIAISAPDARGLGGDPDPDRDDSPVAPRSLATGPGVRSGLLVAVLRDARREGGAGPSLGRPRRPPGLTMRMPKRPRVSIQLGDG